MYRDRKLLDKAREIPCQNCRNDDGTVVAAHSNQSKHGKGKGLKAHDCFMAALCHRCHSWLDNSGGHDLDPTGVYQPTREDKAAMFDRAKDRTLLEFFQRGYIVVA